MPGLASPPCGLPKLASRVTLGQISHKSPIPSLRISGNLWPQCDCYHARMNWGNRSEREYPVGACAVLGWSVRPTSLVVFCTNVILCCPPPAYGRMPVRTAGGLGYIGQRWYNFILNSETEAIHSQSSDSQMVPWDDRGTANVALGVRQVFVVFCHWSSGFPRR